MKQEMLRESFFVEPIKNIIQKYKKKKFYFFYKIVCIEGKMNYRDKLSLVVQNVKEVNEV